MTIIPTGFYEAAFHHTCDGSLHDTVCTLGLKYNGTDFTNDGNGVGTGWGQYVMSEMANVWHFFKVVLRDANGAVKERIWNQVGGKASVAQTTNTAFLIDKQTGLSGRRFKGRMYLPGVSETDIDHNGIVTGGKQVAVTTAMGNLINSLQGFHFDVYLLHGPRKDGLTPPPPTFITGMSCSARVATQRDRMRD